MIITESWSTLNVLGVQVESQDQLAKGVKLDLVASLLPEKGTRNLRSTVEMQHKHVFARAALDLFKGPAIVADVVLGYVC